MMPDANYEVRRPGQDGGDDERTSAGQKVVEHEVKSGCQKYSANLDSSTCLHATRYLPGPNGLRLSGGRKGVGQNTHSNSSLRRLSDGTGRRRCEVSGSR